HVQPPPLPTDSSLQCTGHLPALHSFPTRRCSDLLEQRDAIALLEPDRAQRLRVHRRPAVRVLGVALWHLRRLAGVEQREVDVAGDRKSTRLNSSHGSISYAVFCLKNKTDVVRILY